jgi:hypothetical protein
VSYRRLNRCAGIIWLEELMLGCVQLVLGCVEQCCFFAMGCNLEPPPPLQHDGNAHRGSDHDDGRGRPPVRDDGCEDGDAHAGKDRIFPRIAGIEAAGSGGGVPGPNYAPRP